MLDYVALGILIFAGVTLFYGIIVIHDIPYEIAVHRNHPHQDAIHYAGWVSLFTLHAIWPFLWIWSTLYREDRGWGFEAAGRDARIETEPETEAPKAGVNQPDESGDDITQPNAVQSVNAIEPVVDITETVVLQRHRLEALEDRLERIEQAILAATAGESGDRGES